MNLVVAAQCTRKNFPNSKSLLNGVNSEHDTIIFKRSFSLNIKGLINNVKEMKCLRN